MLGPITVEIILLLILTLIICRTFEAEHLLTDINKNAKVVRRNSQDVNSVCELFRPIRIKTHFLPSRSLTSQQHSQLTAIVQHVTSIASQLFSVYPVKGRLLLRRSSCSRLWNDGINKNRCARISHSQGSQCHPEYCSEVQEFVIPDDHLEGLYVWDYDGIVPTVLCEEGEGLNDTDFILYVKSDASHQCLQQDKNIIGYGTHCQLGEHDRPVAGFINICPLALTDSAFDYNRIVATVLHELFHTLGFSATLFEKLKKCERNDADIQCSTRRNSIRTNKEDHLHSKIEVSRLNLPSVIKAADDHFSSESSRHILGPALQTVNGLVTSHWDMAQMSGSIMAPSVSLAELTFVDNITLSYFEDTGWYCVNFSMADEFLWGKGEGSSFSFGSDCQSSSSSYFCNDRLSGCHYLHVHKATCETSDLLRGCKVYRPLLDGSCRENQRNEVTEDEEFHAQSRCFVSNLTRQSSDGGVSKVEMSGKCFMHHCDDEGQMFVRVRSTGTFHLCPYGSSIKVDGYEGLLECPRAGILCPSRSAQLLLVSHYSNPTTTPSPLPPLVPRLDQRVPLQIRFDSLPEHVKKSPNLGNHLVDATLDWIVRRLNISEDRLTDAWLASSESSILVTLNPSPHGRSNEDIISELERYIESREFNIRILSDDLYVIQLRDLKNDSERSADTETISTNLPLIASLCALVTIIIIVLIIYFLIRQRHQQRSLPTVEFHNDTSRHV